MNEIVTVTTYNQKGGITAASVNIDTEYHLNNELKYTPTDNDKDPIINIDVEEDTNQKELIELDLDTQPDNVQLDEFLSNSPDIEYKTIPSCITYEEWIDLQENVDDLKTTLIEKYNEEIVAPYNIVLDKWLSIHYNPFSEKESEYINTDIVDENKLNGVIIINSFLSNIDQLPHNKYPTYPRFRDYQEWLWFTYESDELLMQYYKAIKRSDISYEMFVAYTVESDDTWEEYQKYIKDYRTQLRELWTKWKTIRNTNEK